MNANVYVRQWDVGSFTDPTQKPYKVSERHDGRWECSCPAWTRHTPQVDCKHIRKVLAAFRTMPAAPVFVPARSEATPANQPAPASVNRPPEITFDGYTIRRALADALTSTNTDAAYELTGRGRREL